jgi:hypothetical protein
MEDFPASDSDFPAGSAGFQGFPVAFRQACGVRGNSSGVILVLDRVLRGSGLPPTALS